MPGSPVLPSARAPREPDADVTLVFDGGSLGNPGQGYGSFLVRGVVATQQPARLDFPGRTTNNEAEYLSLLHGLRMILGELERQRRDAAQTTLSVMSDS